MYYTEPATPRRRARWPFAVLGLAVLLAAVVLVGVGVRRGGDAIRSEPGHGVSVGGGSWADVRYVQFESWTVPVSSTHGPKNPTALLAEGFSHDTEGAVLAAMNFEARFTSDNRAIYVAALEKRTVSGELSKAALLASASVAPSPSASGGASGETRVFIGYSVSSASPTEVSLNMLVRAAGTGNAAGQYLLLSQPARMRWVGGDWQFVLQRNGGGQVDLAPSGTTALPGQTLTATP